MTPKTRKTLIAAAALAAVIVTPTVIGIAATNTITSQAETIAYSQRDDANERILTRELTLAPGESATVISHRLFPVAYDFTQIVHTPTDTGGLTLVRSEGDVLVRVEEGTPAGVYQGVVTVSPSELPEEFIIRVEVVTG